MSGEPIFKKFSEIQALWYSIHVLLTRAPLLRRIIKTMKVSNQLCSTILKQVFLRFHHCFPLPSSILTWQHLNLRTQPLRVYMLGMGKRKKEICWIALILVMHSINNTMLLFQKLSCFIKTHKNRFLPSWPSSYLKQKRKKNITERI